jgi:hypothetical protein
MPIISSARGAAAGAAGLAIGCGAAGLTTMRGAGACTVVEPTKASGEVAAPYAGKLGPVTPGHAPAGPVIAIGFGIAGPGGTLEYAGAGDADGSGASSTKP